MGKTRLDINTRWTGILQKKLGNDYEVIEEGLGGRTTMFDDPRPEFKERNGLKILPIILESHLPLDYVILMLGTTDTKEMMNISSEKTTEGMRQLIQTVKTYKALEGTHSPKILIVVPAIVDEKAPFASKLFVGGTNKTKALIKSYKKLAQEEKISYLNPTSKINVDNEDGVHLTKESHKELSELIYKKIIEDLG